MAKKAEKPDTDPTKTVEPEATKLVVTDGVMSKVWEGTSFVPALQKDMPLAERREAVRNTLRSAIQVEDRLQLVAGELLYEVSKNGFWKEYEFTDDTGETRKFASFEEYCQVELEMARRKAFYLISIYDKFVVELELSPDLLKELEWSKAKELVPVITHDNYTELLDKIGGMSVRQVKTFVAELKGKKGKGGEGEGEGEEGTTGVTEGKEPEVATRMAFKLFPEQLENVKGALAVAGKMGAGDKPNNQLDMICSTFIASAMGEGLEGGLMTLDTCVKQLERTFGVKLELSGVDEERYKDLSEGKEPAEATA